MNAGDFIHEINGVNTDTLSHMEAQNLIKNAGARLQMRIRSVTFLPYYFIFQTFENSQVQYLYDRPNLSCHVHASNF